MKKGHTKGRKCSLRLKNTWVRGLEREREVWEDEKMKTIERDRGEMKKNIKLDGSRGVERCRALKCVNYLSKGYQGSVERFPQEKGIDG